MKRIDFSNLALDSAARKGMRKVRSCSIDTEAGTVQERGCLVIKETALQLEVVDVGSFVLMWSETEDRGTTFGFNATAGVLADTPAPEILALCVGFLLTEFLIRDLGEIDAIVVAPASPDVVRVWLRNSGRPGGDAHAESAGGPTAARTGAGYRRVTAEGEPRVADTLRLWSTQLLAHFAEMERHQEMFRGAGGAHAAAAFSPRNGVIAIAEDLGRHNALDKVVGKCRLLGHTTAGCGVLVSSRINLNMVAKAARAGFEIIAGVSAPSSLAIEAAQAAGMTLCGFVRNGRISAFTHPQRLISRPTAT